MTERQSLLGGSGKMPDKAPSIKAAMNDRYLTGLGLLLTVVVMWTASNFIVAGMETGEDGWNKPFLFTYLNTAPYALYLLPTYWRYKSGRIPSASSYVPIAQDEPSLRPAAAERSRSWSPVRRTAEEHILTDPMAIPSPEDDKLGVRETAGVAVWWGIVWYIGNWLNNTALGLTSVASMTIIATTSGMSPRAFAGFFTLALGRICRVETLSRTKIIASVVSFFGVILVTRSDSSISSDSTADIPPHPIIGDMLALTSACCFAVYVVLMKVKLGSEDRADMQMLLGFAGFSNVVLLAPLFPILHYTGIEPFELPKSKAIWVHCLVNMFICVTSDYIYMIAMLKTTPAVATIGLSLTIPLTLFCSFFIPSAAGTAITFLTLAGAIMVCGAIGILGWEGWKDSKLLPPGDERPATEDA